MANYIRKKQVRVPKERLIQTSNIMKALTISLIMDMIIIFSLVGTLIYTLNVQEARAAERNRVKIFTCYEVKSGDTLTSIAQENVPYEYKNLKAYMDEIRETNHLRGDTIIVGMNLIIPQYVTKEELAQHSKKIP